MNSVTKLCLKYFEIYKLCICSVCILIQKQKKTLRNTVLIQSLNIFFLFFSTEVCLV